MHVPDQTMATLDITATRDCEGFSSFVTAPHDRFFFKIVFLVREDVKCAHTATSKVLSGVEYDSVRLLNGNSQGPAIESKLERNRSSSLKKPCFSSSMEVDLHVKNSWKMQSV